MIILNEGVRELPITKESYPLLKVRLIKSRRLKTSGDIAKCRLAMKFKGASCRAH